MKKLTFGKQAFTVLIACAGSFLVGAFVADDEKKPITTDMVEVASKMFGLAFASPKRDSTVENLNDLRSDYEALRKVDLTNDVAPALYFNPLPTGYKLPTGTSSFKATPVGKVKVPENRDLLRSAIGRTHQVAANFVGRADAVFPEPAQDLRCQAALRYYADRRTGPQTGAAGRRRNQEKEIPGSAARHPVRR